MRRSPYPAALPEFYRKCTRYGVHVGRNTAAATQARGDVVAFVQQVFFGIQPTRQGTQP